jgi:hypothetical protein
MSESIGPASLGPSGEENRIRALERKAEYLAGVVRDLKQQLTQAQQMLQSGTVQ